MTAQPSAIETCAHCHAGLIRRKAWNELGTDGRARAREWGFNVKWRNGCCHKCGQVSASRTNSDRRADEEIVRVNRLEDVLWMAEGGESLQGAADRIGITEGALDKFMRREGLHELLARMILRNPRDPNSVNALAYEARLSRRERVA